MYLQLRNILLACLVSSVAFAQAGGPTTRTPKLKVSPGVTDVQDLVVHGACTGCAAGGTAPRMAFGQVTIAGALSLSAHVVGVDHLLTGSYDINFEFGYFNTEPVCVAMTAVDHSFIAYYQSGVNLGVRINIASDFALTAADAAFTFICVEPAA